MSSGYLTCSNIVESCPGSAVCPCSNHPSYPFKKDSEWKGKCHWRYIQRMYPGNTSDKIGSFFSDLLNSPDAKKSLDGWFSYSPTSSKKYGPRNLLRSMMEYGNVPETPSFYKSNMIEYAIKPEVANIVSHEFERIGERRELKVEASQAMLSSLVRKNNEPYKEVMSFTYDILKQGIMTDNRYRKKTRKRFEGKGVEWTPTFNRDPDVVVVSMLEQGAFCHNRGTNYGPMTKTLTLGLNGVGSESVELLSAAGICVSPATQRTAFKVLANELNEMIKEFTAKHEGEFGTIVDNCDLYERHSRENLASQNVLTNATTATVLEIPIKLEQDSLNAEDFLKMRGRRKEMTMNNLNTFNDPEEQIKKMSILAQVGKLIDVACRDHPFKKELDLDYKSAWDALKTESAIGPARSNLFPHKLMRSSVGSAEGVTRTLGQLRETQGRVSERTQKLVEFWCSDYGLFLMANAAKRERIGDRGRINRLDLAIFVLGPWHVLLNMLHGIWKFHNHPEWKLQPSSFSHYAHTLTRYGLEKDRPDFNKAKRLARVIFSGGIVVQCCLILELSGLDELCSYMKREKPSYKDLYQLVEKCWRTYSSSSAVLNGQSCQDEIFYHSALSHRDLTNFFILDRIIKMGDPDLFIHFCRKMAPWFAGAGMKNYLSAMLEIIALHDFELPESIKKAWKSIMFVNVFGGEDRCGGVDWSQELQNWAYQHMRAATGRTLNVTRMEERGTQLVFALRQVAESLRLRWGVSNFRRHSKDLIDLRDITRITDDMLHKSKVWSIQDGRTITSTGSGTASSIDDSKKKRKDKIIDLEDYGWKKLEKGGLLAKWKCRTTYRPLIPLVASLARLVPPTAISSASAIDAPTSTIYPNTSDMDINDLDLDEKSSITDSDFDSEAEADSDFVVSEPDSDKASSAESESDEILSEVSDSEDR